MNITAYLRIDERKLAGAFIVFVCATFFGAYPLRAGETADAKSTPAATEEPEPKNWIELGIGGLIINGDAAQFKQQHGMTGDVFGGIQDLHYEETMGKGTLTVDGHAILNNDDYDFKIDFTQQGVGYIRGGYTQFRTWYDGNGGFFPVNGQFIQPTNQDMAVDRGEAWIEFGLRMPKLPEITLHYAHQFRNGQKDSTIWGDTNQTGLPLPPPATRNPTRKIAPAFRDLDESRDIISLDISQTFGNTDVGLGGRYEHTNVDNKLQLERGALQLPPVVAAPGAQRFITHRDQNEADSYNGHVTTETRFSDSLWFTTAYSYTSLSSDITGTRIIGTGYDTMYGDPILTLQGNDHGILNLGGMSQLDEQVVNLNFMWMPGGSAAKSAPVSAPYSKDSKSPPSVEPSAVVKNFTVLAAFRYTNENKDSDSTFLDTNTTANTPPFTPTNPAGGFRSINPVLRSADSSEQFDNFAETLELRYTGLANWLFYARGDWQEESGSVREHEVVGPTDEGSMNKDTDLFVQKYTAGVNWYPMATLNLSAQYFYKSADYDANFKSELATPPTPGSERNQRLLSQQLDTNDVNVRLTWRPKLPGKLGTLALVTRYDYARERINGQWGISPAGIPGVGLTGTTLASQQTAVLKNQAITESITWNPTARLYLQGNFSYILSKTDTPSDYALIPNTQVTVLDFTNDYWTASVAVGYALDDKTDLRAEYTYYRADNYVNNSLAAVPYGMGATEYTVSAGVSRQLMKNVILKLQYGYFHYTDQLSGGFNNYEAHSVFSSLQFRF